MKSSSSAPPTTWRSRSRMLSSSPRSSQTPRHCRHASIFTPLRSSSSSSPAQDGHVIAMPVMLMAMAGRETPATKAARKAGIAFQVLEYDHDEASESYGLEAA